MTAPTTAEPHAQETEPKTGRLRRVEDYVLFGLGLALAGFQLATGLWGSLPSIQQRAVHVGFVLILSLVLFARKASRAPVKSLYYVLALAIAVAAVHTLAAYNRIVLSPFQEASGLDYFSAFALAIVTIVCVRRLAGNTLAVLTVASLVYLAFGHLIVGYWGHPDFELDYLVEKFYLGHGGIWGSITGTSATVVAGFLIFGAVLGGTGAADTIFAVVGRLTGRLRGGAGKATVLATGIAGSINGTAVGNAATTAPITVPLMMRSGFSPTFAAALEGVAGTGGQVMPPIMAAAGFIMADLLGVSYASIVLAALVPAFLYFFSLWVIADAEARRRGIQTVQDDEPRPTVSVTALIQCFVPIGLLIYLMVSGFSLPLVATYATLCAIALHLILGNPTQMLRRLRRLVSIVANSAESIALVAVLVVAAQMIIFGLDSGGVVIKLTGAVIGIAESSTVLALVMTAIVVLVLGLGLPTTAAYLMAIPVAVPLLLGLNLEPLSAHFFILYYAVLSNVTPPLAPPVFVAAGIAGISPTRPSWLAMAMAGPIYVLPFYFAINPALLLVGGIVDIVVSVAFAIFGVTIAALAVGGYLFGELGVVQRIVLGVAGFVIASPNRWVSGVVVAVIGAYAGYLWWRGTGRPGAMASRGPEPVPTGAVE